MQGPEQSRNEENAAEAPDQLAVKEESHGLSPLQWLKEKTSEVTNAVSTTPKEKSKVQKKLTSTIDAARDTADEYMSSSSADEQNPTPSSGAGLAQILQDNKDEAGKQPKGGERTDAITGEQSMRDESGLGHLNRMRGWDSSTSLVESIRAKILQGGEAVKDKTVDMAGICTDGPEGYGDVSFQHKVHVRQDNDPVADSREQLGVDGRRGGENRYDKDNSDKYIGRGESKVDRPSENLDVAQTEGNLRGEETTKTSMLQSSIEIANDILNEVRKGPAGIVHAVQNDHTGEKKRSSHAEIEKSIDGGTKSGSEDVPFKQISNPVTDGPLENSATDSYNHHGSFMEAVRENAGNITQWAKHLTGGNDQRTEENMLEQKRSNPESIPASSKMKEVSTPETDDQVSSSPERSRNKKHSMQKDVSQTHPDTSLDKLNQSGDIVNDFGKTHDQEGEKLQHISKQVDNLFAPATSVNLLPEHMLQSVQERAENLVESLRPPSVENVLLRNNSSVEPNTV